MLCRSGHGGDHHYGDPESIGEKRKRNGQKDVQQEENGSKIPFSGKLKWLNSLLWGGSALLAFEHVWHGEVVPWFPFLTAASDPADTAEMLHEMATVGVSMAALVTLVWLGMLGISAIIEKRARKTQTAEA